MTSRLLLVDVHPLLYRVGYSALRKTNETFPILTVQSGPKAGLKTNALNQFFHTLLSAIIEEKPTHVCAAFDSPRNKLRRRELLPSYKQNRPNTQDEVAEHLKECLQEIPFLLPAFGAHKVKADGYEADDVICTYTNQMLQKHPDNEVVILSVDWDYLQVLQPQVKIVTLNRSHPQCEVRTAENPGRKWRDLGLKLSQFLDYRSLAGDAVDNVKGCPGVGPKRAALLLQEYGTLENLLDQAESLKKSKMRENLIQYKEEVLLGREVLRMESNLTEIPPVDSLRMLPVTPEEAQKVLQQYEFEGLMKRLVEESGFYVNSLS